MLRVYLGCIDEHFASRGIRDSIFKRNMILACASSLRVHVKRMKRISKRNSTPNGGRRWISIRKLEAHFRIYRVYFGARWTGSTARVSLIMRFHLHPNRSVSKRVQRFPDVAFSSITGLVTPRLFSISKLKKRKKKSLKAFSINLFLINLRITCNSQSSIRWMLFLLSI